MKNYFRLFKFVKPHTGLFATAVVFMVLAALLDGVSLGMIMPLADIVFTGKKIVLPMNVPYVDGVVDALNAIPPLRMLYLISVGVVLLYIFKGFVGFMQAYLMTDIAQLIVRDIRSKLYKKIQAFSLDYFTHMRGGELMSRITNDVNSIGNAVSYASTDLFYQSFQVAVFAVLIIVIHPKLAGLSLVILLCVSFPIVKVGRVLKKIARLSQEKMADINSILYESILGARVVKAFNMEDTQIKKFDEVNHGYYKLSMKTTKRTQLLSPFTELIGVIAGVVVLFIEGRDVIAGKLSFGAMGVSLAALMSMIRPFKKLSQVNSIFQQALASGDRIYSVLDTQPTVREKEGAVDLREFRKAITFERMNFYYGQVHILKDIDLTVKYGEIVAIVGPSGAGKSTLVDLIPRFCDPKSGKVAIDGIDLREVSFKSLRDLIAIVTQETILFNDTVAGNISFGMPQATQADIEAAAKQAHVHDVIMRLPQGYDTFIGERGIKLSGGERQRLAIARALLKNAPILILDEATSQLDTQSERLVQEALQLLMKGRTVFVIAHRLSTIRHANRILVMAEGRIVEQGTHEALLAKNGLYKQLCVNQQIAAT